MELQMKVIVLLAVAVAGLQYLSAVVHSQEVASLPALHSLWHPNLYIAQDFEGSHYEVRHSSRSYEAALSFLQTKQTIGAPLMNCRCRFQSQGSAPGPGSFLQKPGLEVSPITQVERPGKNRTLTYEMPLSPRVDVEQIHLKDLIETPLTPNPVQAPYPPTNSVQAPYPPTNPAISQAQPLSPQYQQQVGPNPYQMYPQVSQPQPMYPVQMPYYQPQAYFVQQPQGYFQPYLPTPSQQQGYIQSQLYQQPSPEQYQQSYYQPVGYQPRY